MEGQEANDSANVLDSITNLINEPNEDSVQGLGDNILRFIPEEYASESSEVLTSVIELIKDDDSNEEEVVVVLEDKQEPHPLDLVQGIGSSLIDGFAAKEDSTKATNVLTSVVNLFKLFTK